MSKPAASPSTPAENKETTKLPRKRRRIWLLTLVGLGLLVYFLPAIVSRLLPQPAAMAWLSGDFPGTVGVGNASLGWQSPVQLNDVTVTTSEGKSVTTVSSVTTVQPLWDLLTQPQQPMELN